MDKEEIIRGMKKYQELLEREIGKDTLELYLAIINGRPVDESIYKVEKTEMGTVYRKKNECTTVFKDYTKNNLTHKESM